MNFIVIGAGAVPRQCAKYLADLDQSLEFVEYRNKKAMSAEPFCRRHNIPFTQKNKAEITEYFLAIDQPTFLFSISNRYIFPASVIDNEHLTIINYHGALLPKFPGRNAEAWAIFHGEDKGGITWHYVDPEIDSGDIIDQRSTPIHHNTTSIKLLKAYSTLAIEGFKNIVDQIISGTELPRIKQPGYNKEAILYSWMKPNEGQLDVNWDEAKISRFLRSMDYGPFKTMGNFQLDVAGDNKEAYAYKIVDKADYQPTTPEGVVVLEKNSLVFEITLEEPMESAEA